MNSCHQLGSSSCSLMYAKTHSFGWSGLGVGRCWALALCQALLVFWEWLPWEFEAVGEGAGRLKASCHSVGSSGSGALGYFGEDVVTSRASWGSSSSPQQYCFFLCSWGWYGPVFSRVQQWSLYDLITIQLHLGAMHLWRSYAASHRTLEGIPILSMQCWRAWAKARVSFCLVTWKSLMPGESTWGKKSQWCNVLKQ